MWARVRDGMGEHNSVSFIPLQIALRPHSIHKYVKIFSEIQLFISRPFFYCILLCLHLYLFFVLLLFVSVIFPSSISTNSIWYDSANLLLLSQLFIEALISTWYIIWFFHSSFLFTSGRIKIRDCTNMKSTAGNNKFKSGRFCWALHCWAIN